MRPPSSSRPAKASVYAVSIHWRLAVEMCRARCADGRAMITTEASSTTMSWATAMMANARKRLGSRSGPGPVVWSGRSRVDVMASPSPGRSESDWPGPAADVLTWKGSGLGGSDGLQSEGEYWFRLHYTEPRFRLSTGGRERFRGAEVEA